MVTRCAVQPMFRLDTNILAEHLHVVRDEKEEMLRKAMDAGAIGKDVLMSNPKFADLLKSLGVEPPMKVSLATGELTYAFSRQDIDFMELVNHEDPNVQAVMAARLGFKSTLEETRTERMLNIASLDFPHHGSGVMPIPLKIGAAITHRLGGDWQLNCQNWGRQSPIRKAVSAPDGWYVVASDAAQIEAPDERMVLRPVGSRRAVRQRRRRLCHVRFVRLRLPCQQERPSRPALRRQDRHPAAGLPVGLAQAAETGVHPPAPKTACRSSLQTKTLQRTTYGYRDRMHAISNMWTRLGDLIQWMASADEDQTHVIGPVTFYRNRAVGPDGLTLYYENLNYDHIARQWTYSYNGNTYQIFGGKFWRTSSSSWRGLRPCRQPCGSANASPT